LIRNVEVNETSIVKEPLNHEGIENFTSVNLDLTSMDVKIEKSSENAISYRLQDVKKQKLDYSVDDGVLNVKETISDKHFIGKFHLLLHYESNELQESYLLQCKQE